MHYEHFKQKDPRVLKALIQGFPFANISVNTPEGPLTAFAPLTFKQGINPNGILEFHLAKENPIISFLQNSTPVSITVNGPSAPISPSWYKSRFPNKDSDRSQTAPTYDYINAVAKGSMQCMDINGLEKQLGDLVSVMEPKEGWKLSEINPASFDRWKNMIAGFRMPVESFDLTAKISQEQKTEDSKGIIEGLKARGTPNDMAIAKIIELFDGSPESLIKGLNSISSSVNLPKSR